MTTTSHRGRKEARARTRAEVTALDDRSCVEVSFGSPLQPQRPRRCRRGTLAGR